MFHFNPQLTFRNLWNQKAATLINIGGFALGLVCVFYLYFYVRAELGTDQFHSKIDNIYRVLRVGEVKGEPYLIGVTSGNYAIGLRNDYPDQIKDVTRVQLDNAFVQYEDVIYDERQIAFVDKNFFEFFSFELLTGDPATVLSTAQSVVISEKTAVKYFGSEDPIGKPLRVDNQFDYVVTGVMATPEGKSHMEFDMALSIEVFEQFEWFHNWWNNSMITYVNIETDAVANQVVATFPDFMDKYFGDDFAASGSKIGLTLEPMRQTYFTNDVRYDPATHGNKNTVIILIMVAIAIMFIASFNYVNLAIAQSFKRSKEVGVRKMLGGSIARLVAQFLGEVIVLLVISMGAAVGLTILLLPAINSYFGLQVVLDWTDPGVLYFITILFTTTLMLAGMFPALQMAGFPPLKILRGTFNPAKNSVLRKSLVVIQFVISIFLISATLFVSTQLNFLQNKGLGFDKEAVVVVSLNSREFRNQREGFKTKLLAHPAIQSISMVSGEPGGFHDASSFLIEGVDETIRMRTLFTDHSFLETMKVNLVAGSNFQDIEVEGLNGGMLFNETALRALGLTSDDFIGRRVEMPGWDVERTTIGIVEDYHFQSLHSQIEPLAIIQGGQTGQPRRVAIKMTASAMDEGLSHLQETYNSLELPYPLSYSFLDERLANLYDGEQQQGHVFTVFSSISIFLACLGVLGLTSYSARQRQKEFGIRKVLGASISNIIGLISAEFLVLIAISTSLAIPAVVYFLNQWLDTFAYRIQVLDHWPILLVSGLGAAVVAWITISVMTYRAAILKPTESIRNE